MAGSGGRALGPFISGLIMRIVPKGSSTGCEIFTGQDLINPTCAESQSVCCLTAATYCVLGCEFSDSDVYPGILIGVGVLVFVTVHLYYKKIATYEKTSQMLEAGSP